MPGERLFRAVGASLAVEHVETVGHRVDDRQDVLRRGLLAAGEVDNQAPASDTRRAAAQASLGGDLHGLRPHGFGNTGSGPLHHR